MNTPREPLTPDAVDALLSAQLDGDLEGAARELGLSESEAQAQLAATPGVAARREALMRARDLMAERPLLEPAVEDRLVAAAMARDDLTFVRERRGRRERQWRVLVAAGSVAAAIAVVVGLSTMQQGPSSKAASVGASATRQPTTKGDAVAPAELQHGVDFGDVTGKDALGTRARGLLSELPNADAAARGSQSTEKSVSPRALATDSETTAQGEFNAAAPLVCTASIRERYRIAAAPAIIGKGTYSGRPVVILVFDGPPGPVAYVVSAADCSVVRSQPL